MPVFDQQTRVQFNTVLDFREKHLVRPGWCVTVKRCCCCENPPGSPLAKIYWLAPVYFDSVIPGPHWQLLLLSSDPLGCDSLTQFLVSHGRIQGGGGLLQCAGLWPQLQRGANHDGVQDQGQGEPPRQDGGHWRFPGLWEFIFGFKINDVSF